jgi:hypothetical protein
MKLNDLISDFYIQLTNEEKNLLQKFDGVMYESQFTEREQYVLNNMVRKSVISKIRLNGSEYFVKNEKHC